MCGLFGYRLSDEALKDINLHTLLASLAYTAERRGNESWGVLKYNQVDTHTIVKNTGSIKDTGRIKDLIDTQVIGHTRKATVGAISVPNAHPFHIGKIIGVHNGFVENHAEMNREHKRTYEVDSQHIFAHIDAKLPLTELSASGTVVYVNSDNLNEIYFGRGRSSDLVIFGIGTAEKSLGLVWSSSEVWADDALELAGSRDHFLYETKPSVLYCSNGYGLDELGEFELRYKINPIKTFQVYGNTQYWEERQKRISKILSRPSSNRDFTQSDIDLLPDPLKKTQEVMGMEQQEENTKAYTSTSRCNGCSYWGATVDDYEDNAGGVCYYPSTAEYLCFNCAAFWESETGSTGIAIPSLKLMMQDYDEI